MTKRERINAALASGHSIAGPTMGEAWAVLRALFTIGALLFVILV